MTTLLGAKSLKNKPLKTLTFCSKELLSIGRADETHLKRPDRDAVATVKSQTKVPMVKALCK